MIADPHKFFLELAAEKAEGSQLTACFANSGRVMERGCLTGISRA